MNSTANETRMEKARAHCLAQGARMTPIREQVLALLLTYPDVIKAYDVLTDLQRLRGQTAPPTVYRTLDFFVEMGILHRTESLNGFVFCHDFEHDHQSIITSCASCGKIDELPAERQVQELMQFCAERGFALSASPIVLAGVCSSCGAEEETVKSACAAH